MKKISVYLPSGRWMCYEEGKSNVEKINILNHGMVSIISKRVDNAGLKIEVVYSGMPFILDIS